MACSGTRITGLPERMQEIRDELAEAGFPLSNSNGNLPLNALRQMSAEVARLTSELAAAKTNEARYLWLRGNTCADHSPRWLQWEVRCWQCPEWTTDLRGQRLDEAIDAARSAGGEG